MQPDRDHQSFRIRGLCDFMLKPRWIYLTLPLICMALQARAAGLSTLQDIAKIDEFDQSRIVFDFSALPEFRLETSGQRVDLILKQTEAGSSLRLLPEDDKVVKILLARQPDALLVSILLHRIPSRVTAVKTPQSGQISLDIRWEPDGARRPAIAFQLSGMPTAHQAIEGVATPRPSSTYTGRWQDFFQSFHPPVDLPLTVRPTLPALPPLAADASKPPEHPLLQRANAGQWRKLLAEIDQASAGLSPDTLAILEAEALLRIGQSDRALERLRQERLDEKSSPEADRAIYLFALAEAVGGKPYQARCSLAPLLARAETSPGLAPYARLLEAELLLAIHTPEQAWAILEGPTRNWPQPLRLPIQWRQAETLALLGKAEAAERGFRRLFDRKDDPRAKYPDLLYHAARACLETGRYQQARIHFLDLAARLHDQVPRGNALYLAARAAYRAGDRKQALDALEKICFNFEETEPGYRAWMALLDHRLQHLEHLAHSQIAADYGTISRQAPLRLLREEAAFKQILTCYLNDQREEAANLLQIFLRNFTHGPLRDEARALLSEFLPSLIQDLIRGGHDMQAVVLVERHRDLLLNGNLAWPFLPDLARAYTRLGLWEKACKTYYFLIDQGAGRQAEQTVYLPLVELLYDREEYAMAASLAQRYLEKFPAGGDRQQLFLLHLRALAESNRLDEAAALLERDNHPRSAAIALQSARIFRARGEPAGIIDLPDSLNTTPEGMLLRAEALFGAGRNRQALDLYERLMKEKDYAEQAAYRCGQIKLQAGDKQAALKLFNRLSDNRAASPWGKLAGDLIAAENLK